jgi:hypothetical protein
MTQPPHIVADYVVSVEQDEDTMTVTFALMRGPALPTVGVVTLPIKFWQQLGARARNESSSPLPASRRHKSREDSAP